MASGMPTNTAPAKEYTYRCGACSRLNTHWYPECPYCDQPLSLVPQPRARTFKAEGSQTLTEIKESEILQRFPTNLPGLDMVLGGGWIARSVNLVLGQPGSGKSTLLLMTACLGGESTLYHSSEEQKGPIITRAKRLNLPISDKTRLITTKCWEDVEDEIWQHRPRVVINDSIQDTWVRSMPDVAKGGPTQQMYIVDRCEKIANKADWPIAFVIISHVTKDGDFKGHNEIPHKVSSVFRFRISDQMADMREFRPAKNRNGAVRQYAYFQMTLDGALIEMQDPRMEERMSREARYQRLRLDENGRVDMTPPEPRPATNRRNRRRDEEEE